MSEQGEHYLISNTSKLTANAPLLDAIAKH